MLFFDPKVFDPNYILSFKYKIFLLKFFYNYEIQIKLYHLEIIIVNIFMTIFPGFFFF